MKAGLLTRKLITMVGLSAFITACYQPPFNHFRPNYGGLPLTSKPIHKSTPKRLISQLNRQDIQYIQYGDTHTLLVPTDKYFELHSAKINNICYPGLYNIVRLLQHYPGTVVYVAGFTDNVGSDDYKNKLSQAQAEAMLTFLWANNIPARRFEAQGYGEKHDIADNSVIRGSAMNRRIEIQWHYEEPVKKKFLGLDKFGRPYQ